MDHQESDDSKKSKLCSIPKITIFIAIVSAIIFVIYDTLSQQCTMIEAEKDRIFRIQCSQSGTTTNFTCSIPGDDKNPWEAEIINGKEVCTRSSSCVQVVLNGFLSWIKDNTLVGSLLFIIIYITATLLFIPGSLLTIGAGIAFGAAFNATIGIVIGSLCVWIGANIGADLSFLVGKFLFRDWVAEQVKKVKILSAIDAAIDKQGLKTVLLLRLSPVIPFNLFNYLMGATKIKFTDYIIGSLVGMLPGTIAYVFIGAAIGGAASSGNLDECEPDTLIQNIILVVGLIATFAAVFMISHFAKKELNTFLKAGKEEILEKERTMSSEEVKVEVTNV
jgi:uncharacterized membrane protein YdjX (TVP38/TMEM64 family)